MLHFVVNILNKVLYLGLNNDDSLLILINHKICDINIYAHLMLQFGFLVFVLSIVALAVPAYFGLYGSFILTLIPLAFS